MEKYIYLEDQYGGRGVTQSVVTAARNLQIHDKLQLDKTLTKCNHFTLQKFTFWSVLSVLIKRRKWNKGAKTKVKEQRLR